MVNWQRLKHAFFKRMVDPECDVLKSAFRTALACGLCIFLFQYVGNTHASILAGFAAFCFVQNDPQGLNGPRFIFLSAVILVFTLLAFVGMVLGAHLIWFIATLPVIIFVAAYGSCLGPNYFNAGLWALFLYLFASANPLSVHEASLISIVFLLSGSICLATCFFVFPLKPYQRLIQNYRLLLKQFIALIDSKPLNGQRNEWLKKDSLQKFNHQIDHLLVLQQYNLEFYFKTCGIALRQQSDFVQLAKALYQISLMLKSTMALQQRIAAYDSYAQTQLPLCQIEMVKLLVALVAQIKDQSLPPFSQVETALESVRDHLTAFRGEALRHAALMNVSVDFTIIFDYSNYFYHFLKLYDLLKITSQHIFLMQQKTHA